MSMHSLPFPDNGQPVSTAALWAHLQPGHWICLEHPPSAAAHSEALLLCQPSPRQWITWVPEYGEYCLNF
ncbi:MAG: hypothetical protein VKK04_19195 [Synechococcales bacterium]|nr:hypothetical protein [Synechococcales bacterium]